VVGLVFVSLPHRERPVAGGRELHRKHPIDRRLPACAAVIGGERGDANGGYTLVEAGLSDGKGTIHVPRRYHAETTRLGAVISLPLP